MMHLSLVEKKTIHNTALILVKHYLMSIYQKKIVPMLYFMDFDAVKSVIIGIKSQGNFVKSQGKVRELYFLMLVATLRCA